MHSYVLFVILAEKAGVVLILVLMEDALVHMENFNELFQEWCLNPCFNGRCTRTAKLG